MKIYMRTRFFDTDEGDDWSQSLFIYDKETELIIEYNEKWQEVTNQILNLVIKAGDIVLVGEL